MRIITLCLSKTLGGLELYAFRSALFLSTAESVLFVTSPGAKLSELLKKNAIETKYLTPGITLFPLLNAYYLAGIIDEYDADIVHMHWGKDLPLASLAVKLSKKKPALIFTRQMQITRKKTDLYHRYIYKEMSLMLTITEQLREKCSELLDKSARQRVERLYYGVPQPDHILSSDETAQNRNNLGFQSTDFIVGLFGRIEEGKGQHLLIRAIAVAKQEGVLLRAIIVGREVNAGYTDELKNIVDRLDIREHIKFIDFVEDPQNLMQLCDCVVLASRTETFGLVLPEAMRAGIAVIGSNAGGVPEIIEHDKTGLLFEPENISDLKHQMLLLYHDNKKRAELALAGKAKADKIFNKDVHFQKLHDIFQQYAAATKIQAS